MSPGEQAEKLVADFGVTSPDDLDVEAFAFDARLEVEYQELQGCEATLVGFENRAIATVRPSTILGRQRFSIAHELGHWMMHRGRSFRCRVDDPGDTHQSTKHQGFLPDAYGNVVVRVDGTLLEPRPAQAELLGEIMQFVQRIRNQVTPLLAAPGYAFVVYVNRHTCHFAKIFAK